MDQWLPEVPPSARRRRTPASVKIALVGAGVIAGGILAGTMTASASGSSTPTTPTTEGATGYGFPGGHHGDHQVGQSGTVTAVGTSTVTIKTSSGTKAYQVTSGSHILKDGPAKLSDVKSGDAVRFSTTTTSGSTIEFLLDGKPGFGGPPGGMRMMGQSGTVTAVGTSTVTIKTSSGTKAYQVTASSDIDKNGEAKLSDLKVGDAVRFSTTTTNGTTIDKLHAGNEALNGPKGGFRHGGPGGGPGSWPGGESGPGTTTPGTTTPGTATPGSTSGSAPSGEITNA